MITRRRALIGLGAISALFAPSLALGQSIQERTIRWGHLNNTDHPISLGVQRFAEVLLRKSGGKLRVREFAASQLGNEMQMQSAVRGGTQEILCASTTSLATVVRDFGLLDLPFIVSNTAQAEALILGPFGQDLLGLLPPRDIIGLGFWGLGFRNVTNSVRAIARVEDFQGLKLRVIPNPVYLETFRAFGANPVPMNFAELYSALETRTVDGQENPYSVTLSNRFYEVQRHVSSTNHTYTQNAISVSKRFWDRLSEAERVMLQETYAETRDYQREQTQIAADRALDELKTRGMTFTDVTPAELSRMRDTIKPVVERFSGEYDAARVRLFNAELQRIQPLR